MTASPQFLVTNPDQPYDTIDEFVAYAEGEPRRSDDRRDAWRACRICTLP